MIKKTSVFFIFLILAIYVITPWFCTFWGKKLHANGDLDDAITYYKIASFFGSAEAHFNIGVLHYKKGTDQDYKIALNFFEAGTKLGYKHCFGWMGLIYDEGKGLKRNPQLAVSWFKKGIELNDFYSMNFYAIYLLQLNGDHYKEAFGLMENAAKQDYVSALFNVGQAYFFGNFNNTLDLQKSEKYIQNAFNQNFKPASFLNGYFYQFGIGRDKSYDRALYNYLNVIEEDKCRAGYQVDMLIKNWKSPSIAVKAKAKNFIQNAYKLCQNVSVKFDTLTVHRAIQILDLGIGGPKDKIHSDKLKMDAIKLWRKGFHSQNKVSQYHLAKLTLNSSSLKDKEQAIQKIEQAIEFGYHLAINESSER
ncbi:MAG: hypothetical protein COB02_13000 [Candidatus Cloacimonadota bacterium]|nr:MAG: hypothetical protein COB02_13000 [Candidatus Cloacimonadota bacterium]